MGLAALEALVARHRASGLDVNVRVEGEPRPLNRSVDQAAYRILQEALTNAGRHGDARAEIEIAYEPRAVALKVSNPTHRDRPPAAPGHGIVGMRERTALLGGRLDTAHVNGTFSVTAELPYAGETR